MPHALVGTPRGMATKADFNAEEWSKLAEAPVLVGLRVVAADRGGTIRESFAIGKVYSEARRAQGQSQLLDELVASPPAVDPKELQGAGDIARASSDRLAEALRIVSETVSYTHLTLPTTPYV